MFPRQHYKAIAEKVKLHTERIDIDDLRDLRNGMPCIMQITFCRDLADYFAQDNPRFDRAKFLVACGLE